MSMLGTIWGISGIVLVFAVAICRLASRAAQAFSYDVAIGLAWGTISLVLLSIRALTAPASAVSPEVFEAHVAQV